jgi:hypothetical protein
MDDFLVALEQTSLGTFIRESSSFLGFPAVLTVHTIGLCLIFGGNVIVTARLLGVASNIPLKPLRLLFPFMWFGLILTVLSGFALVIAAATTRALNPILLVKLVIIAVATPITWRIQKRVFDAAVVSEDKAARSVRNLAGAQLFLWLLVVIAGRLIAYSATIFGHNF